MNAPIYIVPPPTVPLPDPAPQQPAQPNEAVVLLRQLVGLHQEQIGLLKAQAANQDSAARHRGFLARWAEEFPGIGAACKQAIPSLERAYLSLIREVTDRVNNSAEHGELDDEFVLGEFLDRFGIRLGQLGNILGQVAPLADAAPPSEEKG